MVQDTFIGNLRESRGRGVEGGLRPQTQPSPNINRIGTMISRVTQPSPASVDKPNVTMPAEDRRRRTDAAWNGTMNIDTQSDDFAPAMRGARYSHQVVGLPRTTEEWDIFDNSVPEFKKMLDDYSKESDQQKRFWILKRAAPKFENSDRLYKYLNIMFADELANLSGDYPNFDYKQVKPGVEDAIKEILNFRYHSA